MELVENTDVIALIYDVSGDCPVSIGSWLYECPQSTHEARSWLR